jgi:hypothetical protein
MLDVDTGKVLSLGMPKETFDDAFSTMKAVDDGNETQYLDGMITVVFEDGKAVEIECDGGSNRFEFYNFTFSTEIEQIKGRYRLIEAAGYDFYSRYYDDDGKDTDISAAAYEHTLMVRNGDLGDMKDGEYLSYTIANKR